MLQRLEGEVNSEDGRGMSQSTSGEQEKIAGHTEGGEETQASTADTKHSTPASISRRTDSSAFEWDWKEQGDWYADELSPGQPPCPPRGQPGVRPPVNTWPLGEIVQGRHDALHSRLFNS
jgi:hypothetical protein